MNRAFSFLLVVILALAAPHSVASQVPSPATSRLRVYIDCNVSGCDFDYLRSEIEFVDYMRDRQDASLHVLVTAQPTGSAGTEYVLNFIGKRELASLSDTLLFQVAQTASQDDKRKALAHSLKLGLVRYVAKTGSAQALDVKYASPAVAAGS